MKRVAPARRDDSTAQRRGRPGSSPSLRVLLLFAVGFLATGGIAVALNGASKPPTDMQAEYRQALARLSFPPGSSPRLSDPAAGQVGSFEPGTGAVDAGNAWFCAWTIEWSDHRSSDPARASRALAELANAYPDGLFWLTLYKPDGAALKGEVDRAIAGDGSALAQEINDFGCKR